MNSRPKRPKGKTRELVKRRVLRGITSPTIIAKQVGCSRQAVMAHIRSLRAAGEVPAA